MEQHNLKLEAKFREIRNKEVRFEEYNTSDAEYIFVAYGFGARICQKAMDLGRDKGLKIGLLKPFTLYPYLYDRLLELSGKAKLMLCVELNSGQMVEDVQLAVKGKVPVAFFGKMGGMMPTPEEILHHLENLIQPNYAN